MTTLVGDNKVFVALVRVAMEDPGIRKQLIYLLSAEEPHRSSLVQSLLQEAHLRQMHGEFIAALSYLLSPKVTSTTLELLKEAVKARSVSTNRGRRNRLYLALTTLLMAVFFWALVMCSQSSNLAVPPSSNCDPNAGDSNHCVPPQSKYGIQLDYPPESKVNGETGIVRLAVYFGLSGRVDTVEISKSSGFERLDKAAVAATRSATYPFSETSGVLESKEITILFQLDDAVETTSVERIARALRDPKP